MRWTAIEDAALASIHEMVECLPASLFGLPVLYDDPMELSRELLKISERCNWLVKRLVAINDEKRKNEERQNKLAHNYRMAMMKLRCVFPSDSAYGDKLRQAAWTHQALNYPSDLDKFDLSHTRSSCRFNGEYKADSNADYDIAINMAAQNLKAAFRGHRGDFDLSFIPQLVHQYTLILLEGMASGSSLVRRKPPTSP